MPKAPRIQDVARAAGVSTATVSRALTRPELVSEATRRAVFEAIRATGYRVNRAASNLRRQRAGAVLVLVPNLGNPFFSQILKGISAGFAGSEFSVLIVDTEQQPESRGGPVDYFLDSRIDGMISLDGAVAGTTLDRLAASGVADRVVFACEWVDGAAFPTVRSDNRGGARLAIEHLAGLGHRRIAHLTGPAGNVLTAERHEAAREACAALGLAMPPERVLAGDFSLASGRAAAERLAAQPPGQRPTAVFAASDEMALGLISGLAARGLSVPRDLSVVGFDDIEAAAYALPALTTIRQDRQALGTRAARLLLEQLTGPGQEDAARCEVIDVALVPRASSGPPPALSPLTG